MLLPHVLQNAKQPVSQQCGRHGSAGERHRQACTPERHTNIRAHGTVQGEERRVWIEWRSRAYAQGGTGRVA